MLWGGLCDVAKSLIGKVARYCGCCLFPGSRLGIGRACGTLVRTVLLWVVLYSCRWITSPLYVKGSGDVIHPLLGL